MAGSAATLVTFVKSSTLLRELAGVDVNAKQVERAAEVLGGDRRLRAAVRRTAVPDPGSGYSLSGQDGTGIPMRHSALVGRSGKKEDGSAKTREVKLVTVWSAESHRDSLAGLPHPRA